MLAPAVETQAARTLLQEHLALLPWHRLTCHLHDDGVVPALLQLLPLLPGAAQLIFSKIDWLPYLTQASSSSYPTSRRQIVVATLPHAGK